MQYKVNVGEGLNLWASAPALPSPKGLVAPLLVFTQAAFVVFLSAGHFKSNPGLAWIPFDLTVAAAGLVLVLSLLSFFAMGGKIGTGAGWMVLFCAAMAIALSWTEWTPYAFEKATRFFSLTLLAALLPAIILTELAQVKRFVSLVIVLGMVLSAGVLIQMMGGGFTGGVGERTAGFATVTTALGWDAGLALVGLYAYMLRGGRWLWLLLLCLPLFLALVASGARGPLLFAVGVIAFLTARFSLPNKRSVAIALLLIAAAGVALPEYSSLLPQGSVKRISALLQGQYDKSAEERILARQAAVEAIKKYPLGMGFGGFARVYNFGNETDRIYPHNLILDIAVENGLFVAVLFIGIVAVALLKSYRAAVVTAELQPFFAMVLFAFGNSLVSGELNADRTLFALLAVGLQLPVLAAEGWGAQL